MDPWQLQTQPMIRLQPPKIFPCYCHPFNPPSLNPHCARPCRGPRGNKNGRPEKSGSGPPLSKAVHGGGISREHVNVIFSLFLFVQKSIPNSIIAINKLCCLISGQVKGSGQVHWEYLLALLSPYYPLSIQLIMARILSGLQQVFLSIQVA